MTAHVRILDVLASVRLSQVFESDSSEIDGRDAEAVYRFPVPLGASVCAFEAILNDGSKIFGQVREKAEARKEYEDAVNSGKQASLAIRDRPDSKLILTCCEVYADYFAIKFSPY